MYIFTFFLDLNSSGFLESPTLRNFVAVFPWFAKIPENVVRVQVDAHPGEEENDSYQRYIFYI